MKNHVLHSGSKSILLAALSKYDSREGGTLFPIQHYFSRFEPVGVLKVTNWYFIRISWIKLLAVNEGSDKNCTDLLFRSSSRILNWPISDIEMA